MRLYENCVRMKFQAMLPFVFVLFLDDLLGGRGGRGGASAPAALTSSTSISEI